jgi:oxygen-dependent protoporphyrinogen oxidase
MTHAMTTPSKSRSGGIPSGCRTDVLVCGGGISGLATAAWLRQKQVNVHVLEKSSRPGGVIHTEQHGDYLFETGPSTILNRHASMDELVGFAGLEDACIRVPIRSPARHIWFRGRLHRVPGSPLAFLGSGLLPWSSKLGILRELFVSPVTEPESVTQFIRRRLGQPWLENMVTPMISGIWAGDPGQLSVEHAFPTLKALEKEHGSLIKGMFRTMKQKRRDPNRRIAQMVSFREGSEALPRALALKLGEHFHASTTVNHIRPREGGGFEVEITSAGEHATWTADRVVLAADAGVTAGWVRNLDTALSAALQNQPYNRLTIVGLGIAKKDLEHLPDGFGFLCVRDHGLRILGAIIASNFFAGRAPDDACTLTVFTGGELDPAVMDLDDGQLGGAVKRDLARALGWNGKEQCRVIRRWERGIPQYDMRHGERLKQLAEAEARHPGLHLAGNWRRGTSIAECIENARLLAEQLCQHEPAGGKQQAT